jgi:hypothetical protein
MHIIPAARRERERTWIGLSGRGRPKRVEEATIVRVAMEVVSWKRRKLRMLL